MEYRWIKGFREGSRKLLYIPSEKLLYIFKSKRRGRAVYICYQSILSAPKKQNRTKNEDHTSCTSRVRLLPDGTCEKMNMNHTCHENHEKIVRDMEKTNNMKRKCQTLKNDHPEDAHKISTRNIFQREMIEEGFRNSNLRYKRMKRTLQRHKSKQYPKCPGSIEEIRRTFRDPNILEKYGNNIEGDGMFYVDTIVHQNYAFTVFVSKYVIDFIKKNIPPKSRHYLLDATFDSLPNQYYQLLIISIEYLNDIFPAVYVLMSRKSAECYIAVFEFIEKMLFKLKPNEVMTDYEDGMRLAIRKCWPNATLRGCWFHFCKSIQRKCRKLNLSRLLKMNRNAKIIQKKIMSLPLLPADRFEEGYESIKVFARKKRLFNSFSALFGYFQRYWCNQNKRSAITVIDINMRTTSSVESVNSAIQRSFPGITNIFKFVESLKFYESCKSSDLYELSLGETAKNQLDRKRARDKERENKIKYLTRQLKNEEISVAEFLESMSAKDVLPSVAYRESNPNTRSLKKRKINDNNEDQLTNKKINKKESVYTSQKTQASAGSNPNKRGRSDKGDVPPTKILKLNTPSNTDRTAEKPSKTSTKKNTSRAKSSDVRPGKGEDPSQKEMAPVEMKTWPKQTGRPTVKPRGKNKDVVVVRRMNTRSQTK